MATLNVTPTDLVAPAFVDLLSNQARHLHLYGSAGSGKSHFAARKLLLRVVAGMSEGLTHRFYCLCKTEPEVRRSVFTLLADLRNGYSGLDKIMLPLGSMLSFRFVNGSSIHCMGLDKPEKLKSVERPTGFWMEEADRFTRADRQQINLRMRGEIGTYKQTIYTYNPVTVACTMYTDIHKTIGNRYTGWVGNRGNRFVHHSTWRDNPWLDAEYAEELEELKSVDPAYWEVYSEGLWGSRRHLIYAAAYRVAEEGDWPEDFEERVYGLDFGYNNPSALVEVRFVDAVPYVRQVIYERKLTNTQLIELMKDREVSESDIIWADSAEPARIEEISDAGYDCRGATNAKKPNAVKARIDYVRRAGMIVHPDSVDFQDELETYKWKLGKDEEPLDEPVKFMDHACNAVEYAIYEHMAESGARPGVFAVPVR